MADFTMRLCDIVSGGFDIEKEAMSSYPALSEDMRKEINKFILRHYWLYEIGFEDEFIFAHYLDCALNEIMPYYNQIITINTGLEAIDPSEEYYEESTVEGTGNVKSDRISETASESTSKRDETSESAGENTTSGDDTSESEGAGTNKSNGYDRYYDNPITGMPADTVVPEEQSGFNVSTTSRGAESYSSGEDSTRNTSKSTSKSNATSISNGKVESNDNSNAKSNVKDVSQTDTKNNQRTVRKGHNSAVYENIVKYREAIQNVNMQIVKNKSIAQLFFGMNEGTCDGYVY